MCACRRGVGEVTDTVLHKLSTLTNYIFVCTYYKLGYSHQGDSEAHKSRIATDLSSSDNVGKSSLNTSRVA